MTDLIGQIIFRSSKEVTVLHGGVHFSCELPGKFRKSKGNVAVVGDRVLFDSLSESQGRLKEVLPRENWLSRRREIGGGKELLLAANVDQVVAVFAARQPRLKFGALDRLLVASASQEINACIVINKSDLGIDSEVEELLDAYRTLDYPLFLTSCETDEGTDALRDQLQGKSSVVAGPSGVGKSSLISKIFRIDLRIGEVSESNEKGKHTTSAASWHPVSEDTTVIDTPGFRNYGIWGIEPREVGESMPDIQEFSAGCRFNDCMHRQEPACAVRSAAEEGELHPRRYRSYLGILDSIVEREDRR